MAAPYWSSEDKVKALFWLGGVFALTLATTGISVGFNYLGRDFQNALASKYGNSVIVTISSLNFEMFFSEPCLHSSKRRNSKPSYLELQLSKKFKSFLCS